MQKTTIETDLTKITTFSTQHENENDRFKLFVKESNGDQIDSMVDQINETVSTQIDCTSCGNCCKSLLVLVSDSEATNLSKHLGQSRADFDKIHLEKGSNALMIMNSMPCHFLSENKCTVYDHRFEGCREFPALHLPNFKNRLFTTFMHYDRCPIIFNVVEQLKDVLGFERDS